MRSTLWGSTLSSRRFLIWHNTCLTILRVCTLGVCTLGVYFLQPPILEFEKHLPITLGVCTLAICTLGIYYIQPPILDLDMHLPVHSAGLHYIPVWSGSLHSGGLHSVGLLSPAPVLDLTLYVPGILHSGALQPTNVTNFVKRKRANEFSS